MKVQKFEAFIDSIQAKFGLILELILRKPSGTTISKTPKKKTPSKADRNFNRTGPPSPYSSRKSKPQGK